MCKIRRGRPQPTIQFFFGDQLLNNSSPGIIIANDTLTITSIELDDAGDYRCVADNDIPPPAQLTSTLIVEMAGNALTWVSFNVITMIHSLNFFSSTVPPQFRPYWFPFPRQRLFWPDSPPALASVNVQSFAELVFACRVEGIPKAAVTWTINGLPPGDTVQNFTIVEIREGRSVLIVEITEDDQKMIFSNQMNTIQCAAANAAGSTSGSVVLSGSCEFIFLTAKNALQ